MQKFSNNTVSALKSFVYGLKYPNSENHYFYIGKGHFSEETHIVG